MTADSADDVLASRAKRFAEQRTAMVDKVVITPSAEFAAIAVAGSSAFIVRQEQGLGIPLSVTDDRPVLYLQAEYLCRLGAQDGNMKIQRSSIKVFPHRSGTAHAKPLVRYDFVEEPQSHIPAAHVQFHGSHPELVRAMESAGRNTPRGRRRVNALARGRTPDGSELHFPVGGRRFRPTLEDVLEMLIVEFGIRASAGWRDAIADARENFRSIQLKAAVHDAPRHAVEELRAMGYTVAWPGPAPEPEGDPSRPREI